jgi:hypothetical protein
MQVMYKVVLVLNSLHCLVKYPKQIFLFIKKPKWIKSSFFFGGGERLDMRGASGCFKKATQTPNAGHPIW